MKNRNTLFYLAIIGIAISCTTFDKPGAEKNSANNISMTSVIKDGDCLDQKMEFWFAKFNQLQVEGYGMDEANEKALAAVVEEFKDCDKKQANHMATQVDSIEE